MRSESSASASSRAASRTRRSSTRSSGSTPSAGGSRISTFGSSKATRPRSRIADADHNGIISAAEGDIDTCNDNCFPATPSDECAVSDSSCLFLPAPTYNRFAVTREINDGYLAPRFAPSQRGWVLSGDRVSVTPSVSASTGRDSDDR